VEHGYDVQVVDACGGLSARTEDAAIRRLIQAGATVTSYDSGGNLGPDLQLGISKLARDAANCSGRPVWRRRGSRDQCRLAHCMPGFDPVACPGSARSSDHRHSDLRSTHRAFFGKSQIAHRRQMFLSGAKGEFPCLSQFWLPVQPVERRARPDAR
jgi:hypothetical protein